MKHEVIVKSLIKDDLKKTKLIYVLETIGFVCDDFDLMIFDSIIKLVGIKINFPEDEVSLKYCRLLGKVCSVEIRFDNKELTDLVMEIYNFLLQHRNLQDTS